MVPSLLSPPDLPRIPSTSKPSVWNVDVLGRPFDDASPQPPLTDDVFGATCDLAELLHQTMSFNTQQKEETDGVRESDRSTRLEFHERLLAWHVALPDHLRHDRNFIPETYYLA